MLHGKNLAVLCSILVLAVPVLLGADSEAMVCGGAWHPTKKTSALSHHYLSYLDWGWSLCYSDNPSGCVCVTPMALHLTTVVHQVLRRESQNH